MENNLSILTENQNMLEHDTMGYEIHWIGWRVDGIVGEKKQRNGVREGQHWSLKEFLFTYVEWVIEN